MHLQATQQRAAAHSGLAVPSAVRPAPYLLHPACPCALATAPSEGYEPSVLQSLKADGRALPRQISLEVHMRDAVPVRRQAASRANGPSGGMAMAGGA